MKPRQANIYRENFDSLERFLLKGIEEATGLNEKLDETDKSRSISV